MSDKREGKRTQEQCRSVQQSGRNRAKESVQFGDDRVPIQIPDNMEEMLLNWASYSGPSVGWCLLCDGPILTENDLIPGTNTHNCAEGQSLHLEQK
jgi:hypothetical protein